MYCIGSSNLCGLSVYYIECRPFCGHAIYCMEYRSLWIESRHIWGILVYCIGWSSFVLYEIQTFLRSPSIIYRVHTFMRYCSLLHRPQNSLKICFILSGVVLYCRLQSSLSGFLWGLVVYFIWSWVFWGPEFTVSWFLSGPHLNCLEAKTSSKSCIFHEGIDLPDFLSSFIVFRVLPSNGEQTSLRSYGKCVDFRHLLGCRLNCLEANHSLRSCIFYQVQNSLGHCSSRSVWVPS